MPESTAGSTSKPGLLAHLAALVAAKLAYFRARFELAGIEAKEAAVHFGIILGMAIGMLILLVFGYFFLVISVVFLIAALWHTPHAWIWVMMGAAGFHIAAAIVLALIVRAKLSAPVFAASLEELKKDQEWLKTITKPR